MTNENMNKVICPKCGNVFTCTHNTSCWCTNLILNNEALEYIKANYKGCLCSICLEEIKRMFKINL